MTMNTEKIFLTDFHSELSTTHNQPANQYNKPVIQTHIANYLGMYLDRKLTCIYRNHVEKTVEKLRKHQVLILLIL
jgi:uncharacterized membrane protein affecting hemolysin expression